VPFALRIIEPECIGNPVGLVDGNVRAGLRFSESGEFMGAYVKTKHPGDVYDKGRDAYEFVPVRNELGLPELVFLFDPNRESSSRELPWLMKATMLLNDVSDYKDSELQRKRKEAELAWIIKLNDPDTGKVNFENDPTFGGDDDAKTERSKVVSAQNSVYYLEPNEDIQVVNGDRPGSNYTAFLDSHDRDIGQAVGRSFENVSNNYGAANFSATRVSGIEDYVEREIEFEVFTAGVLSAVWEWAMFSYSIQTGNILYRRIVPEWHRYIKPSWDPAKDAQAAQIRIDAGISSVVEETHAIGSDWERVQDNEIQAEVRKRRKLAESGLQVETEQEEEIETDTDAEDVKNDDQN
jgi:capsid protein